MSPANTNRAARAIVDDVLGRGMTREIWTASYDKVLPISVQDFDLTGVLPPVLYMFRFGYRRGKGRFFDTFGGDAGTPKERRRAATIERVAAKLAETPQLQGFQDEPEQAILGDLLLCFCLENAKRTLGRNQQIQRVSPAHYMASWIDLPEAVAHLRYVPEMIVAMLADQNEDYVEQSRKDARTWFAVGRGFEDNLLLKAFHQGMVHEEPLGSRTADRFREEEPVGLDQLLMIRLAQRLGAAPDKLRRSDGERISNQRPIAQRAARHFSEDIRRFVRAYARVVPRHAFVALLESCMAAGLTTIVASVIELLFEWAETGTIPTTSKQKPTHLFVDCANGIDRNLRALAEQSMDDFLRRTERIPVILMALRLLDRGIRYDPHLKTCLPSTRPYATEWVNLLGEVLYQRRDEAKAILYELERKAAELAERLDEDYPEAAEMLRNERAQPNPVWRLAESLTFLQGRQSTQNNVMSLVDSTLLVNRPNGLGARRAVIRKIGVGDAAKKREVRSVVLTDSVLDYLVHLHTLPSGNKGGWRPLSLKDFMRILHERYGFCVDVAPPGVSISNELLRLNRSVLERRLRDLGLLTGVNDAEAMKQLKPRFVPAERDDHGLD
ncbi:hypothetical protein [Kallotenue papyrolyticum]|uniref:hypothetical protein n=1 Tax=Kallotenue papyrolyticum TaxID=1325125 RepID=UPI0004B0EBB3|nr:hypothetical protein [Kallotenue papyrolyticum]